jgi:TolA-binding protein
MRHLLITLMVASVTAGAGSACATKKFVRGQVDEVNGKVETLSQSLEATQQQTKENAGRIAQVDQKADQAGAAARTRRTRPRRPAQPRIARRRRPPQSTWRRSA